jgi:hypothetical protein
MIEHLKHQHQHLFVSVIKVKLENPDLPEPGDDLHPIWQFFDSNAQVEGSENIGSARCKDCLRVFPIQDNDIEQVSMFLVSFFFVTDGVTN